MTASALRRLASLGAALAIIIGTPGGWRDPLTARAAPTYTAFTLDGEAGAPVGRGIPQVYTDADSSFATGDSGLVTSPGHVYLIVTGTSGVAAGHQYYVQIAAPPGEVLTAKTYTGAVRAGLRGPGQPGLDVAGDGVGCNSLDGQFTVAQVSFTASTLTALAVSYSFTCDGLAPRVAGEVRYASAVDYAGLRQLPAPPDTGTMDFGSSNVVGFASAPRTTQLANAGTTSIALSAFAIDGANPSDYPQGGSTCGGTLAPGASCSWDTTFTATAPGYRYAAAHYTSDVYGFAHGQVLAGYAAAAAPQLQITPAGGWDYGPVILGRSSSHAFTITSIGNAPDTLGTRVIDPTDLPDFAITADDCPAQLAPGASCTVTVTYAPLSTGAKAGDLRVNASDAWMSYQVPLGGSGILAASGVSWGPLRKPGPSYTWNGGGALGRTVRSGVQQLHLAYATNRIGSAWSRDSGPHDGIYYVRSTTGSTWSTPKRLNPTTQHAARLGGRRRAPASTWRGSARRG